MTPYHELMEKLDPQQREVAEWRPTHGHLRVVASAGAGKTTTLVALASSLLIRDDVPAARLVVTTFTKKAGEELRNRLDKIIDRSTLMQVRLGTFHAIGLQTLRSTAPTQWAMPLCLDIDQRKAGIPSTSELWRAICMYGTVPGSGRESLKLDEPPRYYQRQIELWRSKGYHFFDEVEAADMPAGLKRKEAEALENAWDYFNEAKKKLGAWDFGDVLIGWRDLLLESGGKSDIVLVDEAQDNNEVQLEIVQLLSQNGGRICLIGDDKQSIYRFRGAYPEMFREANTRLGADTKEIVTNYRSVPELVQFSNQFVAGKPWNMSSETTAHRPSDGNRCLRSFSRSSPMEEADSVAREIADALLDHGANAGEFAILTRTNAARVAFETALIARNIPTVVLGGSSTFNTREASLVMGYLVLSGFNHIESLERILNTPKRYIPRTFVSDVHDTLKRIPDMVEALRTAVERSKLKPGSKRGVYQLIDTLRTLRKTEWKDVPAFVRQLLRPETNENTEEPDEDNQALIQMVCNLAAMFPDLTSFVEFATKCANGTKSVAEGETPKDCVTISTIHKVKGMEWPRVYVSAPSNLLPSKKTTAPSEEERLFYVAITRARDELVVTANAIEGGLTPFFTPG